MINKGTKIGWVLVALSLVIAIWAVASNHLNAAGDDSDWEIEDGVLNSYKGKGGDVTVPAVVKEIAVGAFASHEVVDHDGGKENPPKENPKINTLDISKTRMSSLKGAVFMNAYIKKIILPKTLENVEGNPIAGVRGLSSIVIASGNKNFSINDGGLYKGNVLIAVLPTVQGEFKVKKGTKKINANAFFECTGINTVEILDSDLKIDENAFENCPVKKIIAPDGSSAMKFATNNNIEFEPSEGGQTNPNEPSTTGTGGQTGEKPNGSSPNVPNPNNTNTTNGGVTIVPEAGDIQNADGSVTHKDGTTTHTDGTITNKQGKVIATGGVVTHSKDTTPKTAGPMDPRYFLALAVLFAGIGVLLVSKHSKYSYVIKNRKNK